MSLTLSSAHQRIAQTLMRALAENRDQGMTAAEIAASTDLRPDFTRKAVREMGRRLHTLGFPLELKITTTGPNGSHHNRPRYRFLGLNPDHDFPIVPRQPKPAAFPRLRGEATAIDRRTGRHRRTGGLPQWRRLVDAWAHDLLLTDHEYHVREIWTAMGLKNSQDMEFLQLSLAEHRAPVKLRRIGTHTYRLESR